MNPKLIINLFKLRTNLDRLVDRCHAVGIKTAIVTKVFCADERICKMLSESDADAFADSRVQNLAAIAELHSDYIDNLSCFLADTQNFVAGA